MADDVNTGADAQHPVQSDEAREATLAGVSTGGLTASGHAAAQLDEENSDEKRISELESRGSTTPIAEGDSLVADYAGNDSQKPVGLMAEKASFVKNGSLPAGQLPTPTGLMPASALATSPEDANKRLEEHVKTLNGRSRTLEYQKLSRAQIDAMSGAELRAVAHDRGYDLGDQAGNRATRKRFIEAQNRDESLKDTSDESGS